MHYVELLRKRRRRFSKEKQDCAGNKSRRRQLAFKFWYSRGACFLERKEIPSNRNPVTTKSNWSPIKGPDSRAKERFLSEFLWRTRLLLKRIRSRAG
jgi:hypothetical protein